MIVNPVELPPHLGDPLWTAGPREDSTLPASSMVKVCQTCPTLRQHLESSRAMVAELRRRIEAAEELITRLRDEAAR